MAELARIEKIMSKPRSRWQSPEDLMEEAREKRWKVPMILKQLEDNFFPGNRRKAAIAYENLTNEIRSTPKTPIREYQESSGNNLQQIIDNLSLMLSKYKPGQISESSLGKLVPELRRLGILQEMYSETAAPATPSREQAFDFGFTEAQEPVIQTSSDSNVMEMKLGVDDDFQTYRTLDQAIMELE